MKKNTRGPTAISSILYEVLKPLKKKNSSELFEIKCKWIKIVGEELAMKTIPSGFYTRNNVKILEISVESSLAFELSYQSLKILEKINNYYNNKYIQKIIFKKII